MASTKPLRSSFGPHLRIITAIATAVVILALALGLGLGLGLKHHRRHRASSSTQSLSFLTPQTSNNFIVGSIVGQSPQDRKYNFTLSLANGAPDGVNKTMLVVNGTSLHPCHHCSSAFGACMTCHVPSGFFVFLVVVQGRQLGALHCFGQVSSLSKSLEAAPRCLCACARHWQIEAVTPRRFIRAGIILLPVTRHFWISSMLNINSRSVPRSHDRG